MWKLRKKMNEIIKRGEREFYCYNSICKDDILFLKCSGELNGNIFTNLNFLEGGL